ncbi:MAG: biotin--[acetyl-CoA-carboxylase] ligase, partial [Burkholderiales bacterium PBB5]
MSDTPARTPSPTGAAPVLRWEAEALWLQLAPLRPGLSVEVLPQATSTNSLLLERARAGQDLQPCLLVAEHQSAGRGRQGKAWLSAPGASLTVSLALPLAPA